jgi:hypothetical protein
MIRLSRRRSLSDVVARNMARPDPSPGPPVDLLRLILEPSEADILTTHNHAYVRAGGPR